MPELKPTRHIEGELLEAEVKQGGEPSREFRRVKIGALWLSCWDDSLFPLMVKGKHLALDYTTTQRGKYTNYNIQAATELAAPSPSSPSVPPGEPAAPPVSHNGQADREASIEAQTAYKGALDFLGKAVSVDTIAFGKAVDLMEPLTCLGYQAIQAAKRGDPVVWPGWFAEKLGSQNTGGASEPQGDIVPQDDDPNLGNTKTPQAPVPPLRPQEAPPKPASQPQNMGAVMEWARGQGKVTGDVIGVLEKAGYRASDCTPLRSIIQVMDAWHEDATKRNPTPATVKDLCMAAWGLKG